MYVHFALLGLASQGVLYDTLSFFIFVTSTYKIKHKDEILRYFYVVVTWPWI